MINTKEKASTLLCLKIYDFIGLKLPKREMLLGPIIPRQGLCMLHAKRGLGKTYLALSIAHAVASGGEVFGRWKAPKAARVLFIDGEMPASTLQERLKGIIDGSSSKMPDNDYLRILTPDLQETPMPNLATPEDQKAIEPFLEGVSLVIIDNLATLANCGKSNEAESWLPMQAWLLELRRRGIAVLLVHHQGMNGDQRGTSAREDILDTIISLDRPSGYKANEGARFKVRLTKARGIFGSAADSFEVQLTTNENGALTWVVKVSDGEALEKLRQLFVQGYSIRGAAEALGVSKTKVQNLKKKLDALESDISFNDSSSGSIELDDDWLDI